MGDSTKTIIKIVVIGGAAWYLYWAYKDGWLQAVWENWFGPATPPAAPATGSMVTPPATVTTTPPPAAPLASSGPYVQALAAIKAAANNAPTETFDGWSYYWQNAPIFQGAPLGFGVSGSISPNLFGAVVAAGGGNNNAQITADTFVGLLAAQQAQGVSGLAWFGSNNLQQAQRRSQARFLPDYAGWVN